MLSIDHLHGSLTDPVLDSVNFLNEVMGRYPDAISFAPGAPRPAPFDDSVAAGHIRRYLRHLREARGADPEEAERLISQYGPARGLINDLVSQALRTDHGIDVAPESVVITVGAQEGMFVTLRALFSPGDVLAVAEPCFVGILGAARLLDIEVVPVSETDDGIDLDQLAGACRDARARGQRVRALYVAPDHSNPSGTLLDLRCRRELLALAHREDLLLLEDNAYAFTAAPDQELPPLKALDGGGRVVLIGTFAKVCLPGARVGYVVAGQDVRHGDGRSAPLAELIAAVKSMVTVNTSPVSQAVIGGMLLERGGSISALGEARAAEYRQNLRHLLQALDQRLSPGSTGIPGVSWNRPRGGFFVRVRVPVRADAELLELSAAEFGVLWTPMTHFHVGDGGTNELRLSCSYLSHAHIDEGVERLAALLDHVVCGARERNA
ncbi:GntR family transcriptional regulator [Nocardiopsis sp. TSRI0078]|uniref:aminotransferase-like domain-containing protein n=1 Tax=unclassified Nocardiopsis TaxID=2649073 RepID=UPI000938DC2A|nr:PLP-dependent aminotransferase family protein [Nocardiopsis sp. TSRI0078]OKI23649.1 GntR family transcriptional regulator [Nocardiopsis sp. TSRI0078]